MPKSPAEFCRILKVIPNVSILTGRHDGERGVAIKFAGFPTPVFVNETDAIFLRDMLNESIFQSEHDE